MRESNFLCVKKTRKTAKNRFTHTFGFNGEKNTGFTGTFFLFCHGVIFVSRGKKNTDLARCFCKKTAKLVGVFKERIYVLNVSLDNTFNCENQNVTKVQTEDPGGVSLGGA